MFKTSNAATAATLARLNFKKWGMSVHDGRWYVGTYVELMEIGCLNAYDSLDDPTTVDENRPFKPTETDVDFAMQSYYGFGHPKGDNT